MSTVGIKYLFHNHRIEKPRFRLKSVVKNQSSLNYSLKPLRSGGSFCNFKYPLGVRPLRAASSNTEILETKDVFFKETFILKRIEAVEGKISIRLDSGKNGENWQLTVGCNIPGSWVLHWGVSYIGDVGSEWDQPPLEMRPPGSIPIKDYAIETPLKKLSSSAPERDTLYEVTIDFSPNCEIAAIRFVLKDEENGAWHQHQARDFEVPLMDYLCKDDNTLEAKKGFGTWQGTLGKLSNMLLKAEDPKGQDSSSVSGDLNQQIRCISGFYEEHSIVKQVLVENSVNVSVKKCPETARNLLYLETDLIGDVVVHWGVCRDDNKTWEIPASPHPPETKQFKNKALQTQLQPKADGHGSWGSFTLDEEVEGFLFVLKLNENTWFRCMGNDFYIPLSDSGSLPAQSRQGQSEGWGKSERVASVPIQISGEAAGAYVVSHTAYTDGIINEIRNLVSDISSEKRQKTKTKEAQESILQEIEKLAAEAYSIFRSSAPTFSEDAILEAEALQPPAKLGTGTGSGFEILCQGFNWESNKSGRWYMELNEKVSELSSLGFTVVWLPPPTESVSPEGYMPRDLYNLNSRYGNCDELRVLVESFHKVGMIVLGDVVLNHRCAHYQNQNGIWNIFGGRLNWDDRAIVADDPHFQGRGNKSNGDNFHAAPNIDHSQDFVRKDIKEWLCWLRLIV